MEKDLIIKALECCLDGTDCTMCPLVDEKSCPCVLNENALSLINELSEENESLGAEKEHLELVVEGKLKRTSALEKQVLSLTEENKSLKQCIEHEHRSFMETFGELDDKCKSLYEENERLEKKLAESYNALDEQMNFYCSFTQSKIQNCPIDDEVAKAKADTVRKMSKRIKEYFPYDADSGLYVVLDQIAKEMLENADDK